MSFTFCLHYGILYYPVGSLVVPKVKTEAEVF